MGYPMKIALVCSHGGHFDEAVAVLDAFAGHSVFLITYGADVMGNPSLGTQVPAGLERVYRIPIRGITRFHVAWTLLDALIAMAAVFRREKPDIIFSTGSEIALPAFFLGKFFFGTRLVFLETATRVVDPSLTGKILYPFADLFLVQWEAMLSRLGPRARYFGSVF